MNARYLTPLARRMAPVVVLVLGLHVLLLATPVRSARATAGDATRSPLQVRIVAALPLTLPSTKPVHAAVTQASPPVDAFAQRAAEPSPPAPEAPPAEPIAQVQPAEVTPPMPDFGLVLPGIDSDDDYFPRALLTHVPSPIEPVLIDYPVIDRDPGHHSSELTLFIDETGRVARVRFDGAELPIELEAAARNAFLHARFYSGEVDGRAVKSQIRIEVVFDSRAGNA